MAVTRHLRRWAALCLAGALAGCGAAVDSAGSAQEEVLFVEDADPAVNALSFVEDELLVQPYPGADPPDLADLYADAGAVVVEGLSEIGMTVLRVPPAEFNEIAQRLADSGLIETVQKNYLFEPSRTPNDPIFSRQTHLSQIRAADAWDTTVGVEEIIIAIVDTGVDTDHPDLADKIIDGWNVYDGDSDYSDVHGHGTLVAGVAAALSNNRTGVAGVAWDCSLLAIRATDERGRSSARHIAAGILWAVAHDASVINVSFAPLWSNRVVRSAAQEAFARGSLVVISAGNAGGTTRAGGYAEALFVGAINTSDQIASFSDRGPFVDLVAPGTGIRSTEMNGEYGMANGTSFAAPIVAGVAALAWSVNSDLRPTSIESAIVDTSVDLGPTGKDTTYGHGAVDAAAAVDEATRLTFVPDATPPTLRVTRPSQGAILSGRYTARATATDKWGVADVVLSIDGVPLATDTRAPFRFVVDTSRFPSGTHTLSFVATDLAGNSTVAKNVRVTFRLSSRDYGGAQGRVTFRSHRDGAQVTGNVTIRATVSDSNGLATMEWLIDGQSVYVSPLAGESSGVEYVWRTTGAARGRHTVTLTITDSLGNRTSGQLDLVIK